MWKTLIYNCISYDNFVISEDGKVKNLKTNHIYKIHYDKNGYAVLSLPMGARGKVKTIKLHKALAETFIKNPNSKEFTVVHHKDENTSNYDLSNLEWTTPKLNTQYHWKSVSKTTPYFNNRKLTKDDVLFIRKNKDIYSNSYLASMFNVSKVTIINVKMNRSYID